MIETTTPAGMPGSGQIQGDLWSARARDYAELQEGHFRPLHESVLQRSDIEARDIIDADAGSRVIIESKGLRHSPPEILEKLARGDKVDPAHYYFRTAMRFETADPALHWLNRILALARGQRDALSVRLDVYEVT